MGSRLRGGRRKGRKKETWKEKEGTMKRIKSELGKEGGKE